MSTFRPGAPPASAFSRGALTLSLPVSPSLTRLGWDDGHQAAFDAVAVADAVPARVSRPELGGGQVLTTSGPAGPEGHQHSQILVDWGRRLETTPTVGDWVVVAPPPPGGRP